MIIKEITLFQVPISFGDQVYKTVKGAKDQNSLDGTVLRLRTDGGLEGWGEISPWGRTYLPEFAEAARAGIGVLAPQLVGCDASDMAGIHKVMDAHLNGHAYIKSAIDIALWDLMGKHSGLPIYKLLGGRSAAAIPMNCAVYHGPFEEMAARIDVYRSKFGYKIFSTKPGGQAAEDIVLYQRLSEIRRPVEIFIADANRAWTILDALRVARAIEGLGFNIEQPCDTYEGCLRVRRATNMSMTLDESVMDGDVLARAFRDNAADVMHLKVSRIGGISAGQRMQAFCQIAGMAVSWAASGGTEIADMAALHLAAATPRDNLFGLWSCREFNIDGFAHDAPKVSNGTIQPPEGPGLGITPDTGAFGTPLKTYS